MSQSSFLSLLYARVIANAKGVVPFLVGLSTLSGVINFSKISLGTSFLQTATINGVLSFPSVASKSIFPVSSICLTKSYCPFFNNADIIGTPSSFWFKSTPSWFNICPTMSQASFLSLLYARLIANSNVVVKSLWLAISFTKSHLLFCSTKRIIASEIIPCPKTLSPSKNLTLSNNCWSAFVAIFSNFWISSGLPFLTKSEREVKLSTLLKQSSPSNSFMKLSSRFKSPSNNQ